MNRRAVIRLGAFAALAATRGFVPPASAQSKTMFKASDVHPTGYPTVVAVRVMLVTVLVTLFVRTSDPFFLAVTGVVAVGLIWTAVAYLLDRREGNSALTPQGSR